MRAIVALIVLVFMFGLTVYVISAIFIKSS